MTPLYWENIYPSSLALLEKVRCREGGVQFPGSVESRTSKPLRRTLGYDGQRLVAVLFGCFMH